MPFWIRKLDRRPCDWCHNALALWEIVSPINEVHGQFCRPCAAREVKKRNATVYAHVQLAKITTRESVE
jgi:hypothetical protein